MKYKSEALAAIHEMMEGAYNIGAIDKKTMRGFDKSCLTEIKPLSGGDIKAIREKEALSQAAFAIYLNVGKNHVSAWERGVKKPSGAALKLLTIVKKQGYRSHCVADLANGKISKFTIDALLNMPAKTGKAAEPNIRA